jgi:hypothetical protein
MSAAPFDGAFNSPNEWYTFTLPPTPDGTTYVTTHAINNFGHASSPPVDELLVQANAIINADGDGCTDARELATNPLLGGRRAQNNPWDFYDVDGDRVITVGGDIFLVAQAFGPVPPNDPRDRRKPPLAKQEPDPTKREVWDMGPPDGVITQQDDILGVAAQFGHDCR